MTFQNNGFFDLQSVHEAPLSSFFTFPGCFECQMAVERLRLSSSAATYVVVWGSVSVLAFNWSLSTSDDLPPCSSSSRLLYPLQNFFNHHCTICLFASSGPDALLMLLVSCPALWPILNLNKKIAWIYFLFNIISAV